MKIHNLMEDLVFSLVNEICDEKEKTDSPEYCTTVSCRMDIACYVLNRIAPKYVTSGRGLAHVETDYRENKQVEADIITLVKEGLNRVSHYKRSYYDQADTALELRGKGPFFNFPTIKGRLINGQSFEPVRDIDITLLLEGDLVNMADSRWQNPFHLVEHTGGNFMFWPYPVKAVKTGEKRAFEFEIRVDEKRFEYFCHFFTIELVSDADFVEVFQKYKDFNLKELYLLPK